MLENNSNFNVGESAIKRIKKQNLLRRQRIAIIALILTIAILVVALATVLYFVDIYTYEDVDGKTYYLKKVDGLYSLCYKDGGVCDRNSDGYYQTDAGTLLYIDTTSGKYETYAVVDTSGTEVLGYSQYVLMFKQLTYDISSTKDMTKVIKSIDVSNDFGGYRFEREGDSTRFVIKGHEATLYNLESFAKLSVACGYTISMQRLENPKLDTDGSIDYSEYGLVPEVRIREEVDADGNNTTEEYEYIPTSYVITTMSGEEHKVILGDMSVTGSGYYARYEGRDTVYVLGSNNFSETVFKPVESFVTPMIVYPMKMNNYFDVSNFIICNNIDYDAIISALMEKYPDGVEDEAQFNKDYAMLFEQNSHTVCNFSLVDIDSRSNTMDAYIPYKSNLEYTDGYYINSSNIDVVLYNMYSTSFIGVEKLSPSDEELEKYGLDEAEYIIAFNFNTTDENGNPAYIENFVQVSKKSEDGVYYAYSSTYDMIVSVAESSFEFLEWDEIKWYDSSYIQLDISHVSDIVIESPEFDVHFSIDDSASKYMTYFEQAGSSFSDGKNTYNIKKDQDSGKYVLVCNDQKANPVYQGDYLIAPLVYTKGVPQSEKFIFVESKKTDINGDGEEDAYIYYFYNVVFTGEEYSLAAQITIADLNGNKLSEDRTVLASPYYETDFYITNSSYLYFTGKTSFVGQELERVYAQFNRGRWGRGNLFKTADEKYVLVNSETGEWSIIDDISCGLYCADKVNSRLSQRAVTVPALYDEKGNIKRYGETYYPQTEEKMQYDESTNSIQIYNSEQKIWENMSYSDCTIGVWNKGAYYLTEGGVLVIVNEDSGDWGYVNVSANESYIAEIFADDILLDYHIKTTNHVGRIENSSAMDNFKQFYKGMLFASFEGMAELSDEEKANLRKLDSFGENSENNPCQLKITIYGEDLFGNRRDVVYRIYQYTERKSYITIEAIFEDDGFESTSSEAYGNFYILRSFADKIIEDAKKMVNKQEVDAVTKY